MLGGIALGRVMRRLTLPDAALYPLQALAGAGIVYGLAAVLHGSGFLAVFVAGIMVGDLRAPYKYEVEHVTSALASLGEIVVFVALGLTIDLGSLDLQDIWLDGIVIAAALTFLVRPLVVAALLSRADLAAGREGVHLVGGHARSGADPAGRVRAAGRRRAGAAHLRDRVRGGDVLGAGAGLAGAAPWPGWPACR